MLSRMAEELARAVSWHSPRHCLAVGLILSLAFPVNAFQGPNPTTRKISEEPEFDGPIENLTSPVGKEAILSCVVNNLGKYKVGWLRAEDQTVLTLHMRVVTHSARISVTNDASRSWRLRIRPLRESDRGCYMCQLNTGTMKKQIGCIDVHVPPDIVNDDTSADLAVQEMDNATLSCKATGHPAPRITWRREDGQPILMKKPGSRDLIKMESYTGPTLQLWRVDRRQMGAFLCIASNDVPPAVSKRITLNVNFAPFVRVRNQLLGAPLGTDVELECNVEAFPNTINYWVKNRGEMLLDGHKYSIREKRTSYKVSMWLTIRQFSRADIGTYNCVSTNSLGKSEGTLRLYEIRIQPKHLQNGNHSNILEGQAEAAKGHNLQSDASNRTPSYVSAAIYLIYTIIYINNIVL